MCRRDLCVAHAACAGGTCVSHMLHVQAGPVCRSSTSETRLNPRLHGSPAAQAPYGGLVVRYTPLEQASKQAHDSASKHTQDQARSQQATGSTFAPVYWHATTCLAMPWHHGYQRSLMATGSAAEAAAKAAAKACARARLGSPIHQLSSAAFGCRRVRAARHTARGPCLLGMLCTASCSGPVSRRG
jgi:hypothetical protein